MSKRTRQYMGIISAVIAYYVIHEGAHFLCALCLGVFKRVNFMGIGIQIDIFAERLTDLQLGIFCILGSVATLIIAYALVLLTKRICKVHSKVFKACIYYITIIMLFLDPMYLSILCGLFGGGDMNGIALLIPEVVARIGYGVILVANAAVFWKVILPKYAQAFSNNV